MAHWKAIMYGTDALKIKRIYDGLGNVQSQLYTLKAMGTSTDFAKIKMTFLNSPQTITNNFWATYKPVQKANPSTLTPGDEIQIATHGPGIALSPIYVRVMNVESNENSFSMTFATLEGHTDAGYITFSGILNPETGQIEFNIFNETRENIGATFGSGMSRSMQIDQWEDVMGNVKEFMGKNEEGKSKTIEMVEHIQEFKYDETKPAGKGELVKSTTETIDE